MITIDTRPFLKPGTHPIETGRYIIPTKQIDGLCNIVETWIQNRTPGGIVHGRPRIGKSWAVAYLLQELNTKNTIPTFSVQCRHYKIPGESAFFEDLLRGVGHMVVYSNKANLKRDRLNNFLVEKGLLSKTNRVILILDDAQRLHSSHYDWLMDVYNDLNFSGVFLSIILVGQNELLHQRSAFIAERKAQIIGRFMVHTYHFEGIKKITDMKACLEAYDINSEYPSGSGWSFVRYFFPDAYLEGFRLASEAENVFTIFKDIQKENRIKKFEIPMQYFSLTIEYVLKKYGINGLNRLPSIDDWKKAIISSGYIHAESFQDILLME
ncbi:MAG: ATP-binding protein [Sporomusaceae bacterium]|nr:ATP-binding protein [Sporomusaceae bacterium]